MCFDFRESNVQWLGPLNNFMGKSFAGSDKVITRKKLFVRGRIYSAPPDRPWPGNQKWDPLSIGKLVTLTVTLTWPCLE